MCLIDLLLPIGYVVSGILMVALPLMGIYLHRRKRGIGLVIFGAATLTFFVSQLLYIPLNYALESLVSGWLLISSSILTVAIILGVFMALTEESLRFLVLRHFKGYRKEPVAFGLGWGVAQPVLLGVLFLLLAMQLFPLASMGAESYVSSLNESGLYSTTELEAILLDLELLDTIPWYLSLVSAFEPLLYIVLQVSFTLIMLQYFSSKKTQYLLSAFLLHAVAIVVNLYLQLYNYYLMLAVYALISSAIFFASLRISGLDVKKFRRKYL